MENDSINVGLLPNSFETVHIEFEDTAISYPLNIYLIVNCITNRFIEDPHSKVYLALTPDLIQKMVQSSIIESKAMIKFKFISYAKQARDEKMDK